MKLNEKLLIENVKNSSKKDLRNFATAANRTPEHIKIYDSDEDGKVKLADGSPNVGAATRARGRSPAQPSQKKTEKMFGTMSALSDQRKSFATFHRNREQLAFFDDDSKQDL